MRLIDVDALSNAMYRKSFETDDGRQRWDSGLWIRYKVFEEARDEAPTIDAVPVVRCKDCKWHDKGENESESWNMCMYRPWSYKQVEDTDFCSDGERKDDED